MSANEADLIADNTRVVPEDAGGWRMDVARVIWIGVQPELQWRAWRRWKRPPGPERIAHAQRTLLHDPRCFRCCSDCGERCNVGQLAGDLCHACAERRGLRF